MFWHQGAIKAHRILISDDVVNVHLEYAGWQAGAS